MNSIHIDVGFEQGTNDCEQDGSDRGCPPEAASQPAPKKPRYE